MHTTNPSAELDWERLSAEAVEHLRALLRFDTTNPPGNEIVAIQYMRERLAAEGLEAQVLESAPGRANLWARLQGDGTKRPLLLLSHVDVVPVEREQWSRDPFGGEIHDGYIYGRGAVDMKDLTAKQLALFLQLAREVKAGRRLKRDVVLLTVADEEAYGTYGMAWLVKQRPELVEAEYALNEGGGFALDFGGQRFYMCETAQKGCVCVTLRANGDPGHASVPHQNNAVVRLARAITRLSSTPLPLHVIPTMRQLIGNLAATQRQPLRSLLPQLLNPLLSESIFKAFPDKGVADALRAMLHNTATPTILQAGSAINVIPGSATAQLDCRIIPGQTEEMVRAELRQRIADPKVEIELDYQATGHESGVDNEFFAAIHSAIETHDPGAKVTPYLLPAVTDSRFIVPKGVIAYGFDPMRPEPGWPLPQQLAHAHDERISVANIGFGLRVLYDIVTKLCQ